MVCGGSARGCRLCRIDIGRLETAEICIPAKKGIALSLMRMNRIKEINFADAVAIVEPGVITADLKTAARSQKLFYPPDPASMKDCSIGGNMATNAGGPRCLKYGVTRNYVTGLEVVLANGDV